MIAGGIGEDEVERRWERMLANEDAGDETRAGSSRDRRPQPIHQGRSLLMPRHV